MSWGGAALRTRPAKASHQLWEPSPGQAAAVEFLCTHARSALWADPGAGKTSITLAAFSRLKAEGRARTMLVVAPLRVCQLQWRQEAAQWTQFRGLKIAFLHGPKKGEALREPADIYLINFDGLVWLAKQFRGNLPFDVVCLDESTKIKNYAAERSKALRKCTGSTPIKIMLTGTPNPNGYEDLYGQFLWLDNGQALGKAVTHFRDMYFRKAFNGFDYDLQKGGGERIEQRIAHLVHRLPFTDLPPLVNDVRWCEFSPEGKRFYKTMDKEQVVRFHTHDLPVEAEITVVAGSTGAHQSAREQMANGAIYEAAGSEEYIAFDDAKLDALDELIEEMNGQPLLVAFQFHHDIERIRARRGKDIAVLAGGVSAKQAEEIQRAWNAGEIKELYVHPASIGHGLNLQRGGASHVCWFSATFDLEMWEQLIRRLWRQGNKAPRIVNHILAMKGTIDEDKLDAVVYKSVDQARLLQSMEQQGSALPSEKETTMSETRLGFQAGNTPAPAAGWGPQTAPAAAPAPQGSWGPQAAPAPQQAAPAPAQGGWGAPQPTAAPTQVAEVQNRVQGGWGAHPHTGEPVQPTQQPEQGDGARHFSPEVQQAHATLPLNGAPTGYVAPAPTAANMTSPPAEAEKPKRTRTTKSAAESQQIADHQTRPVVPVSEDKVRDLISASNVGYPSGATVSVNFHGDPASVKQAMRDFLNA